MATLFSSPASNAAGFVAAGSHYSQSGSDSGGTGRHTGRIVAIVVAVVLVVLIALGALAARAVLNARGAAQKLADDARAFQGQVDSLGAIGITEQLPGVVPVLSADLDDLQGALDSPVFSVASVLPVVGQDVRAALSLVDTAQILVDQVATPALPMLNQYPLDTLYENGSVNADGVKAYCAFLGQIAPSVERAAQSLDGARAPHVQAIQGVLDKVQEPLQSFSQTLGEVSPYVDRLPDVLGCNGTRTYLVVAQNNAEIRSTGGMPGAMMYVSIENGKPYIGEVSNAGDFANESTGGSQIELSPEEYTMFGPSPGNMIQNVSYIPDFPRVAELLSQYWQRDYNVSYDGVIALDIPMLARIVAATGDVTMTDGTVLNADTTSRMLSHDVYVNYPEQGEFQDAYFIEAANRIMGNLFNVNLSSGAAGLMKSVRDGIDTGHLLAWMANPQEQALIQSLGMDGALSSDPATPQLGVYFSDATWSKIDWYLSPTTTLDGVVKNADGTKTYNVTTSLTNTIDPAEITSGVLNAYIYGYNDEKYDEGDMLTWTYVLAPIGADLRLVTPPAGVEVQSGTLYGHQALWMFTHTEPGETTTLTYQVTVAPGAEDMTVLQTPTPSVL